MVGGVGSRTVVAEFTSSFSGRCVIEDVAVDCGGLSSEEMTQGAKGLQFRRLIFLNNPNVIQSEAKMIGYSLTEEKEEEKVKSQRLSKQSKRKQKKKSKNTDDLKWTIDHNHMACKYHKVNHPPPKKALDSTQVIFFFNNISSFFFFYRLLLLHCVISLLSMQEKI